ncbi:hypothetical protein [Pseudomonas aeruginosa]|uniref:hypothetical protein n=1 Tax=Pseudomonas aeruginosa TaxID=287 RepID=UPI000FC3F7E4|nr:hypothetical protein [Pseudomonas aeruginosa]EIU1669091.1 hypothetical protein [Pseudomonas aeruginosa]RUC76885.1 hypothetical protein IPC1380_01335 [Pseudomonas aeruginosa]
MKIISDDIDLLKAQEADLERQLYELRERRAELERGARPNAGKKGRPLRDITLDLLQEAQCPLNSLLLASVIRPLHGRNIPATRFGTLSNDEASSFESTRVRPVYLCHCLTHDQGQAVKRFWGRSDWPLAERIMGPMTGRVLFLKGAAWTIALARQVSNGERVADNPETLQYVAADQARDAGMSVRRGEFPFDEWLATITADIARYEAEDKSLRDAAAQTLMKQLSERDQLFGARTGLVSLPGSKETWRSSINDC